MATRHASLALVLCALALVGLTTAGPGVAGTTFVVRNTNDTGPDSLRAAILAANASPGPDTIRFNIPGPIPYIVTPASPLPAITDPVLINGQSQPGFVGNPQIELDHGNNNYAGIGLDIAAGSTTVQSISFVRFATGIRLHDGDGNTIRGCWLGLDVGGVAVGNTTGIAIQSSSAANVVGGTTAAARNVISANTSTGLVLDGMGTTGNVVEGNYVGTDAPGAAAMANGDGIVVSGGAHGNTIGGTSAAAGNLISGNYPGTGATLRGAGTNGNLVEGNVFGADAAQDVGLQNGTGVLIAAGASGNTVGGTAAGAGNSIYSSWGDGVELTDQATTGNTVAGNFLGGKTGFVLFGNGNGVAVRSGAHGNTIGGTAPGARNVFLLNRDAGILIDGAGTTGILVEGNDIGTSRNGVTVSGGAHANTIGGTVAGARNLIWGNSSTAIHLSGPGTKSNLVEGNYIGTDATGTARRPNGAGVAIDGGAGSNTIGGTTAAARNLISGNGGGVSIDGSGTNGNVVEGNYIGTDATGAGHLGNGAGVSIGDGASGNRIGGTTAAARNVVSGNQNLGIGVAGTRNVVEGNYIGVDVTGAHVLFNYYGVSVGGTDNTIGGTAPGAGNVISGSIDKGVDIFVATGVVVAGNRIGTDASGTFQLGNAADGIAICASTGTIGGTTAGAGNTIASNAYFGVEYNTKCSASTVSILGNSIYSNYYTGIASPENAPAIDSVTTAGGTTKIKVSLASAASTSYRIELFVTPTCEGDGYEQGKTFLGAKSVTTDASGNATTSLSVAALASGQQVTATATNLGASPTSRFSYCAAAP